MSFTTHELPAIGGASVTAEFNIDDSLNPQTAIFAQWPAYPRFWMNITSDSEPFFRLRWATELDSRAAATELHNFGRQRGEPEYSAFFTGSKGKDLTEAKFMRKAAALARSMRVETAAETLMWRLPLADETGETNLFCAWGEVSAPVTQFEDLIGRTAIHGTIPPPQEALPVLQTVLDTYAEWRAP